MTRYYGRSPHPSMPHLNGNLFCAIDVETTGATPGYHEIWQMAILPLNEQIEPSQTIRPFYMNFRLNYPERIDKKALNITRSQLAELQQTALDQFKAMDVLDSWFQNLTLPLGKKITPLAQNWVFDRGMIIDWLGGIETFDYYIHFHGRDTMTTALFINDYYDYHCEKMPFPKVGLPYLGSVLGVPNLKAHDALQDCIQTAGVYKKMLNMFMPSTPGLGRTPEPVDLT